MLHARFGDVCYPVPPRHVEGCIAASRMFYARFGDVRLPCAAMLLRKCAQRSLLFHARSVMFCSPSGAAPSSAAAAGAPVMFRTPKLQYGRGACSLCAGSRLLLHVAVAFPRECCSFQLAGVASILASATRGSSIDGDGLWKLSSWLPLNSGLLAARSYVTPAGMGNPTAC